MQSRTVPGHIYHVACQKGPLKRDFLDNYLTTFSESVISEIQKLWELLLLFFNVQNLI